MIRCPPHYSLRWVSIPIHNGNMQLINLYLFYELGFKLHPLLQLNEDTITKDTKYTLYGVQDFLERICNDNVISLSVSKPAAWKLFNLITAAIEMPDDQKMDWYSAYQIRKTTEEFETVLSAELQSLNTYFVSKKGIYSTQELIERTENFVPESIRKQLPEQCVIDIRQAGKCLAFDIPTAAAFHILRATESVIRLYYKNITGHMPKPKLRNWGAYIKNLEAAGADKKITAFLDHIREMHRNPILHPEEMLSSEEAMVLLGAASSSIVQMINEIQKKSNEPELALGASAALRGLLNPPEPT